MEYDDQLDRALEQAPETQKEENRFEIPDVDLRSEGHVTIFENFQAVASRLDRDPDHLLQYLQRELGTSASIDETARARLTGEFRESRVTELLATYAEANVICPECGLPDTSLEKRTGTTVLKCEACGALASTSD